MTIDTLRELARALDELAPEHPIGKLQAIRKVIKGFRTRPGTKLFSRQTTFEKYAFHHGGRPELQFNIGYSDSAKRRFRYGVAFSFERSRTLPSPEILVPKVKLFNEFMTAHPRQFNAMRMRYDDENEISHDLAERCIPWWVVKPEYIVFFSEDCPIGDVDVHGILNQFDSLLDLYMYVESGVENERSVVPVGVFSFRPGISDRAPRGKTTLLERELDIDYRHNRIQSKLSSELVRNHGSQNVGSEVRTTLNGCIDIVVRDGDQFWYYEIKTSLKPRICIREGIGQLLEYSFWPGAKEPTRFIVVGETPVDEDGSRYLDRLRNRFSFPIEYQSVSLDQ